MTNEILGENPHFSENLEEPFDVEIGEDELTEADWLKIQADAFRESTDFLDSGLRSQWEKNLAYANSKHPKGSKYHSDSYKHRSKIFRGKTNAAIRKNNAAAAVALFSTQDVLSVSAEDDNNENQQTAAEALHELANYRLETSISWFLTCLGAYREAQTIGIVVSEQYWEYEEESVGDEEFGLSFGRKLLDRPVVKLHPAENCRVNSLADWVDPVNSSPYFIILEPMYIGDIKLKMEAGEWIPRSDSELRAHTGKDDKDEGTDDARNKNNSDPEDSTATVDHETVWTRKVFLRHGGEEYVFYALGDDTLLSYPEPLKVHYPHCKDNRRPVVMGMVDIEPHVVYKTGLPERVEGSQVQANDVANLRFDNIQLALNKRYLADRKAKVDFSSVTRNIPGSITLTDDMTGFKEMGTNDVTGSSYQEQNLVNADFDDLAGTFSGASVNTNRALNETVGGMKLLSENSNVLTEYQLRVFVETWVEPVLRELVSMIQTYEDEDVIQAVTGKPLTSADLQSKIKVRVNVGFGATDPQAKVGKLMMGLETLAKIFPDIAQQLDRAEVSTEVFGALGFKDGKRFIPGLDEEKDPQVEQLQQQIQKMQAFIEKEQGKHQAMLSKADMDNKTKKEIEQMRQQTAMFKLMRELASKEGMKMADIKALFEGKQFDFMKDRTLLADETKVRAYFSDNENVGGI